MFTKPTSSQKLPWKPRIWHAFYIYCFHCCHSYLSWLCMPACFKGMCWDDFEEWVTSWQLLCEQPSSSHFCCHTFWRTRSFHQTTTAWESWREIQFLGPFPLYKQAVIHGAGYAVPIRRAATCTRVAVRNGSRHPRLQRRTAFWAEKLRSPSKSSKVLNTIQTTAIKLNWLNDI